MLCTCRWGTKLGCFDDSAALLCYNDVQCVINRQKLEFYVQVCAAKGKKLNRAGGKMDQPVSFCRFAHCKILPELSLHLIWFSSVTVLHLP